MSAPIVLGSWLIERRRRLHPWRGLAPENTAVGNKIHRMYRQQGCPLSTERVADAAMAGRLPGRGLRKIDLPDDYEPRPEIVTGTLCWAGRSVLCRRRW